MAQPMFSHDSQSSQNRRSDMFTSPTPSGPGARSQQLYPDLPTELRTPAPTYNAGAFMTPEQQRAAPPAPAPVPSQAVVAAKASATDGLSPLGRAARSIAESLEAEKRYPQLDDIVSQGASHEYEMAQAYAWEPFQRINNYTIPDAIFEQYNRATSHTLMGLFAEIRQAWITVDNRLYMWDYQTQSGFQGFEGQSNTITSVRLLKPKRGVFQDVNYVLVIATTVELFLMGVNASTNARGTMDVTLYDTKMSVPTRGLDVTIIEGSNKTGRIFFAGKGDNDVYEFNYQAEERWFQGRCGKTNHTNTGVSLFAPRLPSWAAGPKDAEFVRQIVIDDSRSLLYTLSSRSTIRIFQMRGQSELFFSLSHPFAQTLSNIRVMVASSPQLTAETPIVSISAVTSQQARRTHLVAVTKSGCRLFMSAVSSDYTHGPDAAPTNMQVIHIRYPPTGVVNNNVRRARVFTPGFFFCFLEKGDQFDELLLSAPDAAKIQVLNDAGGNRLQLVEHGGLINLDSRVEACEMITGPFAASSGPAGFGNEPATQHDIPSMEIAVLTNSGVHIIRRRRLVEIFDATLRYGSTSSPVGIEGEVRRFFETYGRAEGCASALAVACGASAVDPSSPYSTTSITDVEVHDLARKYFIEFGGKPRAENVFDASALPSLDNIRVSGRAEGLILYISRIIRSIWHAFIVDEVRTPAGGLEYRTGVPVPKLQSIQEKLVRLATFLEKNKSFIVGLSGAESLMVTSSKIEEVANQAEHRMLHSLVTLIEGMIEGISFALFLFDDKLTEIILSLDHEQRAQFCNASYATLFSTPEGQTIAKELVTAIVNRNIAAGVSVDTIADALRRRCGSFCSADDVVVFKALEQVKNAKSETDPDIKNRLLREGLRLFEETAASLTLDNLQDMVAQFRDLDYYPGAVQLALSVAREADRGNLALQFLTEPPTVQNATSDMYNKRCQCYELIFRVLEDLDNVYGRAPEMIDGVPSAATRLRNETWSLIYNSEDELFHYRLYDWLFGQGGTKADRLIDIESPFILGYLQYKGGESLDHCELLYQYHQRRENFYQAALVLHELAVSEFPLSLEKRLEFFSRAKNFCQSTYGPARKQMNELNQQLQEELDVAAIQHDLLKRLREDDRITDEKKLKLQAQLGQTILSLSDLFNRYASPYGYHEICLCIFQAADWRGQAEIKKCWEQLISAKHTAAKDKGDVAPFEVVADCVRRYGSRFHLSEFIFPPTDLIPLLEVYAYEHQRDVGPPGWVVDTFIEAGIAEETILRVLEEMFWRDEIPFRGTARRRILQDAVYAVEKWWTRVVKRGGGEGFRAEAIAQTLKSMLGSVPRGPETDRVERLLADVRRRGGSGLI